MNEQIIQKLVRLQVDYEKSFSFFKNKENDFALFEHECKFYFEPLVKIVIPQLKDFIKTNEKEKLENYLPYILKNWQASFVKEFKSSSLVGAQFLFKLSESTIKDFNSLLLSYQKTNSQLQQHFLEQFFKTKSKSILILLKNDPELGLKTIANLKSPRLQFLLINKNFLIFKELESFFMQTNRESVYRLISLYCNYPHDVKIENYVNQWIGNDYVHIKFCRNILGQYYEDSKKFMKKKNEIF